jgi:hypothetical protein
MSDALTKIKHKLQEEIKALEHELNIELPKELMKARAHGDLSENAEYKFAKERQGYVNARIGQLKKRLGDLGMLNLNNIPKDRAASLPPVGEGLGKSVAIKRVQLMCRNLRVIAVPR